MLARFLVLTLLVLLVGCADDPQSCREAHGTWDGVKCSLR